MRRYIATVDIPDEYFHHGYSPDEEAVLLAKGHLKFDNLIDLATGVEGGTIVYTVVYFRPEPYKDSIGVCKWLER